VRIAPKEVLIADPEALKVIYALRSGFTNVLTPKSAIQLTIRAPSTPSSTTFSNPISSIL
jgi:hypothetical protein